MKANYGEKSEWVSSRIGLAYDLLHCVFFLRVFASLRKNNSLRELKTIPTSSSREGAKSCSSGPRHLSRADAVDCFSQYFFVDPAHCSDAARGMVYGFLNYMTRMALGPLPVDLVRAGRLIQTFPPLMIRLAAKAPTHCFDHVTRVRMQVHATWFTQRFEGNRRRRNLCLLISC